MSIQQLVTDLPPLVDKCAVTLASRLNASKEQIRVQEERSGFFAELTGFLTGESARRQRQVNSHHQASIEVAVAWLSDLTDSVALGHRATTQISQNLRSLKTQTVMVAEEMLVLQDRLKDLSDKLDENLITFDQRLTEVDLRGKAGLQIDFVFSKWVAGRWDRLAIAAQCYAAFEELYWGDFGSYLQTYPGPESARLLESVYHRASAQLSNVLEVPSHSRLERGAWFATADSVLSPTDRDLYQSGLQLLGDWATEFEAPFVSSLVRSPEACAIGFPHLMTVERFSKALQLEVFDRGVAA